MRGITQLMARSTNVWPNGEGIHRHRCERPTLASRSELQRGRIGHAKNAYTNLARFTMKGIRGAPLSRAGIRAFSRNFSIGQYIRRGGMYLGPSRWGRR